MIKVSCIIPAYNEMPRIKNVLEVVDTHPLIDEVIVIDDGSKDELNLEVKKYKKINFITNTSNMGKSYSISKGIEIAKGEILLFIDADLVGLKKEDITLLLNPVINNESDMSISLRSNAPKIWRKIGIDYISGERAVKRSLLQKNIKEISELSKFGLEVYMNQIIIGSNCKIKVVFWSAVISPYKYKKYGLLKGVQLEILMLRDIFKIISVKESIYQIYKMKKLMI